MRENSTPIALTFIIIAVLIAVLWQASGGIVDFFENDTLISQRAGINLIDGTNITITAVDDVSNNQVDYTIDASGATSNTFQTIDAPTGTDPVADTTTDTLQILITGSDLTITGTDDPETLTFDIVTNAGTDITADLEEEAHCTEHDGTGTSCTSEQLDFAAGELNDLTWGDNTDATITWTVDPTGSTNPVWSYSDSTANLSIGLLQEGGNNVLAAGDSAGGDVGGTYPTSLTVVNTACTGTQEYLDGTGACDTLDNLSDFTNDAVYGTIKDEDSGLTDRRFLNFIGASVSCVDDAVDTTDCTFSAGGIEDFQATYDLDTNPVLITLDNTRGGLIFEGDAETSDPTLLIRDSTANKAGIVLDNDDEAAEENSPFLRFQNSTVAGGDTQFTILVNTSAAFVILGDDDAADFTIDSSGSATISNGLVVTSGTINFPGGSVPVDDLAITGSWSYGGTLSGNVTITGAWGVDAAGSISFASGADLLVAGGQIDYDDLAQAADILTSSNVITFGANGASNPTIIFDTDEGTDASILFDAVTDNRFEVNKGWDAISLSEGGNAVASAGEEGVLDADVFATCDSTSDNLVDSTCIEQNAGTDISADLEEEAHNDEHADGGDDLLYQERTAIWAQAGDVDTTMDIEGIPIYADRSGTIKDVRCSVGTAGTTSVITIDVNKNGTTIFTTQSGRPEIAAAGNTDVSDTPDVTTYSAGDYFTIEIDATDSGDTGADLVCQMRVRETVYDSS